MPTWAVYAIVCPMVFLSGFVDAVAGGGYVLMGSKLARPMILVVLVVFFGKLLYELLG